MKKINYLFILILILSLTVSAASVSRNIVSDLGNTIRLQFNVDVPELVDVEIEGNTYKKIKLQESGIYLEKGMPELRHVSAFLAVPYARVRAQVVSSDYEDIENVMIAPSKGNIMRNQIPADIPYEFGDIYQPTRGRGNWWPAEEDLLKVSEPFVMREISGVRVEFTPFQYNHSTNTLRVFKNIQIRVESEISRSGNNSPMVDYKPSEDFQNLYSNLFMNYQAPQTKRGYNAPAQDRHLLIIAYDDFYAAAKKLADWKTKQGYIVDLKATSQINGSSKNGPSTGSDSNMLEVTATLLNMRNRPRTSGSTIVAKLPNGTMLELITDLGTWKKVKTVRGQIGYVHGNYVRAAASTGMSFAGNPEVTTNQIQDYIDKKYQDGELCFVTFFGDIEHIPCKRGKNEYAHSDTMYVKLAGSDNIPDAFISRISVKNLSQASAIVDKTIRYERNPISGSWYKKAIGIASDEGNPPDYDRVGELHINLRDKLGFTKFFKCYAPLDYKSKIFDGLKEGASIINYVGHGSDYSWVTSGFNTSDTKKVENGMKLPVIWSVACVNGNIQRDECFAEAWLRAGDASGDGCIGIAASTTNMAWVPPCVWQGEIINNQTANKINSKAAVQNLYGMLKTCERYGSSDSSYGNQLIEQVIYFGEGSVSLRTSSPREVQAKAILKDGQILVAINGENRNGLTVTAYDDNVERAASTQSGERGYVAIPYQGQTHVTVWGDNIVPVVDLEIIK